MGITDDNLKMFSSTARSQGNDVSAPTQRDREADLIYALERVLYCEQCHGHGKVWRRNAPDLRCDCRSEAIDLLNDVKGEQ